MAELAKKLHFLKDGTEQTAKAYSTVDEAGDSYVPLKIDGVACYAPLGATTDAMATNGRVIKGSTTYAIKSQAKLPYTEISYTTAGTHTFTVPAGVTRLRVAVCGGGAGGVIAAIHEESGVNKAYDGTQSSFGNLISATGASTGSVTYRNYGEDVSSSNSLPGSPNGKSGSKCDFADEYQYSHAGATGFAMSFTQTNGTYGSGGNCSVTSNPGWRTFWVTGSSGGYDSQYITVTSSTTYSITVGSGGSGRNYNGGSNSYLFQAGAGNSGFVLIAYGGDI